MKISEFRKKIKILEKLNLFHIILFEPEIPPNTGNIIRLSANTGFEVHLIEPLGFKVDDKNLKRAGMDYLKKTDFQVWISLTECLNTLDPQNIYTVSTKGKSIYSDLTYSQGDAFIFGPESHGLPQTIIDKYESITIPMKSTGRSINLANAVSIVVYEAWRQNAFK